MEANKILHADMLDILFENRNKAYGAYDLRVTYPARVKKAIIGVALVSFVFATGILLANSTKKNNNAKMLVKDYELTNFVDDQKKQPIIELHKPKEVQTKTLAVTIPKFVPDDQVKENEVPPNDEMDNFQISTKTNLEGADGDIVAPPLDQGTGATEIKSKEQDFETKFITDEREAEFPGGLEAWQHYLERNLNTEIPVENGAPVGKYTVMLSFNVDENGNISDIQAMNDPGYGTAEEAIRVIKKSKQWTPAVQNGRKVNYRQQQAITFIVNEG